MAATPPRRRAVVLVGGEFAKSPRMQYHAISLSKDAHFDVDLLGFTSGNPCCESVETDPNIHTTRLLRRWIPPPPLTKLPFALLALLRALVQLLQFTLALILAGRPDFLLIQTPPAVPYLPLVQCWCYVRRIRLVVDWHNYGYTLLQGDKRKSNPVLVGAYKALEMSWGSGAFASFCVSEAMRLDLQDRFGVRASVLYDKAPEHFCSSTPQVTHNLFLGDENRSILVPGKWSDRFTEGSTPFTIRDESGPDGGKIRRRRSGEKGWVPLLVSSTSWTEDEDFGVLLDALRLLDERGMEMLVVITGDGPQRDYYVSYINENPMKNIEVRTGYLKSFQHYAQLLGSADLGVCLHTSSSGVDLPMKVVDMFGCRLPVVALGFSALPELVKDGVNGLVVEPGEGCVVRLAEAVKRLLMGEEERSRMVEYLNVNHAERWDEAWRKIALPVFSRTDGGPGWVRPVVTTLLGLVSLGSGLMGGVAWVLGLL